MPATRISDVDCEFTPPTTLGESGTWLITCSICKNKIGWRYPKPVVVARLLPNKLNLQYHKPAAPAEEVLSLTCPYKRSSGSEQLDCGTQWSITYDPSNKGRINEISDIKISPTSDSDRFWTDYAKKMVGDNLDLLDKRSEYMITTIAALIATNFAVLFAFDVGEFTISFIPNILLAISAAFFAIAHFAIKDEIQIQSPEKIRIAHKTWLDHKYNWQKGGYIFFVLGLIFIGITYLISQNSGPDIQHIEGDLNLNINP